MVGTQCIVRAKINELIGRFECLEGVTNFGVRKFKGRLHVGIDCDSIESANQVAKAIGLTEAKGTVANGFSFVHAFGVVDDVYYSVYSEHVKVEPVVVNHDGTCTVLEAVAS